MSDPGLPKIIKTPQNTKARAWQQLDWSPPVVNAIDWTWFGRAHTPVYIRSYSWQCMSEQKTSHEVEAIVRRAPRQDLVDAQILGKVWKVSAALNVPKNTVASIILKWKKFVITKTHPRAGCPAKLSNWGRRALGREVSKKLIITLTELQSSSVEMG